MDADQALMAMRDLVVAAEAAGWDLTENKTVLDRARDGLAALEAVHNDGRSERQEGR